MTGEYNSPGKGTVTLHRLSDTLGIRFHNNNNSDISSEGVLVSVRCAIHRELALLGQWPSWRACELEDLHAVWLTPKKDSLQFPVCYRVCVCLVGLERAATEMSRRSGRLGWQTVDKVVFANASSPLKRVRHCFPNEFLVVRSPGCRRLRGDEHMATSDSRFDTK